MSEKRHVVYKATLGGQLTSVEMPIGAVILHAEVQHDRAAIWFRCNPNARNETRHFQAFMTGHRGVPTNAAYIGTVLFDEGRLVYHVFEVFPPFETQ